MKTVKKKVEKFNMFLKILVLLSLHVSVMGFGRSCSHESALQSMKRPTYEFSIKILDRVSQETDQHFVFSPLSTWTQLMMLAEGARGNTLNEIWKVTRHHRMLCFRRKLKEILNKMDHELRIASRRKSVIIVDKFMNVKTSYKHEIEKLNAVEILLLDFNNPEKSAAKANQVISSGTDGVITNALSSTDFNFTVLLMADTSYLRNTWMFPFNSGYTKIDTFYSEEGVALGQVKMMERVGYFNLTDIPLINAQVLEIPCSNDRISMLLFLSTGSTIKDLFLSLKHIRLMTIFNLYKTEGMKLTKVKIPRFKIHTDIDNIPELIYDMGVERIFYPNLANLKGISDYELHTSLMTQITDIEVTEKGVKGAFLAEFLIADITPVEFVVNRPFAFMIVDKQTEIILFAGIYSTPSVY